MTPKEATAIMAQLDIVPKRLGMNWRNVEIDRAGRAVVEVMTVASTPTIQKWFDDAGACVTRIERDSRRGSWYVWFDWK